MKKLVMAVSVVSSVACQADVQWDIDMHDYSKITGKVYVYNLTVGDKAKISSDFGFCTTKDGELAISETVEVGSGDAQLTMLPGMKVAVEVEDTGAFLKSLISSEAYAECSWWTAHKGKYLRIVDTVNGKSKMSDLAAEK